MFVVTFRFGYNMRCGDFEVLLQVRRSESQSEGNDVKDFITLEEKKIGNKTFAVAKPNTEYIVKVILHRNSGGNFVTKLVRIGIFVDNKDCNYWKRLDTDDTADLAICTTFKGFKVDSDELRAFVFALPVSSEGTGTRHDLAGSVKVDIYECVLDKGIHNNISKRYERPTGSQVPTDSKFYQQPSVTTTGGRNINDCEKFEPLVRWKNKRQITSIVLFYHTEDIIDFLLNTHKNDLDLDMIENKRKIPESISGIVDLTDDSEECAALKKQCTTMNHYLSEDCRQCQTSERMEESNDKGEDDDDDIQHLTVVKHIPCVDISDDVAQTVTYIKKEC